MTETQATRTGDVLSWATDLDEKTMAQAHRTANLSFVHKPLALMADAHLGTVSYTHLTLPTICSV